ncbi:tyrosine-type recombinase/integrase [Pelomonas sp. V22]|uniref:tyrosine-type recombinase/integrase n=1 Tax=Pelomonas sp. V22 TaxID=2822139 RepID=UPI0024A7DD9F|nr:tyrosine-type recombinase/integrase [Pelomonas sp. V22]MDI4633160.1 tyrosine-type recombinase/integrase [Pelomonas sp. V22]
MPLSDTQIRNAKPRERAYRMTDGGGLQLEVRPTGGKFWRFRYRLDGRENMFAAGLYVQAPNGESASAAAARIASGQLTLAEARRQLLDWRAAVKLGKHPAAQRDERREEASQQQAEILRSRANTFKAVAAAWINENKKRWTASYASQIERAFEHHLYPPLGSKPIGEVSSRDLTQALISMKRLRPSKVEGGAAQPNSFKALPVLLKQWASAVFRHAIAEELIEQDPTYALKGRVKRVKATNHAHLDSKQIPALLAALEGYGGNPKTIHAMRLLLLTFTRPGELRRASWHEFDLVTATWAIPKERMKMRRPHLVPLSTQAAAELRLLAKLTGPTGLLFPNERDPNRPMSATTLNRCLERLGFNGADSIDFSSHGFRSTASTMLNESGKFREDAIERQLAHVPKNEVRGVYNKAKYWEERVEMMQAWSDMIDAFNAHAIGKNGGAQA